MSFDNYETKTEYIRGSKTCVYYGSQELVIDDSFDDYGGYQGTRNYCTCEKAKLEQQMKREVEIFENKKKEIQIQYEDKLQHDEKAIIKAKLEGEICESLRTHVAYGKLYGMTKDEFLVLAGEMFDRELWEYYYVDEEDEETY